MQQPNEKNNLEGRELSITRLLNAPRELVWEVWTNPEHIKNWWGPEGFKNSISKMEVTPGGEWEFIMHGPDGTDYKNKHIYLTLIKPEKIVLHHVSFPNFIMTATFEAQGDKTLVSLHSVFDSAEQLEHVIRVFKADVGMVQNMDRMERYVTGPAINSKVPFIIERTYNTPVSEVWHAITNKEAMKQWYFDLADFKLEVGFEFSFWGKGKEGEDYLHLCKITDVVKEELLRYSWRYDGYEGISYVSFELFGEDNKTRLRLTHEGLESFPVTTNNAFAKENFAEGWTYLLTNSLPEFLNK